MGTNTGLLAYEDWSARALFALATPRVLPVVGPDEEYQRVVRALTTWHDLTLEIQSWLKAGEETLWRIDTLFS